MLSELDEIKLTDLQVEPLLLGLIQIYNTKKTTSINLHELSYFQSKMR